MLDRPVVTTMGMRSNKETAESAFGAVEKRSVFSYQQPLMGTRNLMLHQDAPPYPLIPLEGYCLAPTMCMWVCTEEEYFHLPSLQTSLNMAYKTKEATRFQSSSLNWHRLRQPSPFTHGGHYSVQLFNGHLIGNAQVSMVKLHIRHYSGRCCIRIHDTDLKHTKVQVKCMQFTKVDM